MSVPTSGVRFRIFSVPIDEMLAVPDGSTIGKDSLLFMKDYMPITEDYNYDDCSWFTIKPSKLAGYFYIYNYTTRGRLFANQKYTSDGTCGLTNVNPYDDQRWKFKFNEKNEFQLINKQDDQKLFLRNHQQPHIGLVPIDKYDYRDQFFRFFYEEFTVRSVDFKLEHSRIISKVPNMVANQTFSNMSSIQQDEKFIVKYTKTKQEKWSYTGGFKVTAGMKVSFKAKVPFLGETEDSFSLGIETDHHWTNETMKTEAKELQVEFPVKVPPMKKLRAKATINEETGEVPFVMTLYFEGSNTRTTTSGMWTGVQSIGISNEITEWQ